MLTSRLARRFLRKATRRVAPKARAPLLRRTLLTQAPRRINFAKTAALVALGTFAASNLLSTGTALAQSTPLVGEPGTARERTFIAIKPDGVQRALVGEVISRFEAKGYKLVAIKMITPSLPFAEEHYSDLSNKPFFPGLVKYFSSGPVVAMIWEGRNVIKGGRKLVGATNPDDADPGSIRGDFAIDVGRNIIHGSDSPASAAKEIKHWFTEKEVRKSLK
eukprot:TRINITY_DN971_c0_g1_i3.p1 TRINITY_DN971_c0_g1~~TRINITY_DN971_c0_g1_i3.p1  ORF type:complete len:220 (+),score=45.61 TRINITY_DN971_c0_g1_i3:32-691(+)